MNGNPDAMKEFEILTCPLAQSNLIEASAGTGKTFAIAGIVVRLLVEKPLCIGEILVVTYTIAATEELRDRIRKAIRKALDAFVRGAGSDPFLAGLVERHPAPEKAVQLLKTALRDFDGASIHTIHGFCQQTLRENAFESMNPFDQTLIADERPLVEEIVQDFWRRRLYDAPIEVAACALERGETPKTLAKLAQKATRVQACCTVTEDPSASMASIAPLRAAFADVCAAWETCRPHVLEALGHPGLNRTKYRNPAALGNDMDRYVRSGLAAPSFPKLGHFTASAVAAAAKKGATPPEHPFFHLCEELHNALGQFDTEMDACMLRIKTDLLAYVRQELPRRKERLRIQSFDDLLANLDDALGAPGNDELIEELRKRYGAALIDEFQDTDPVQYAIFRRIFHGEGRTLFLIGDPKQAIYGFRGADLFTYMAARKEVENRYTLSRNWRSDPELIHAVNTVFTNAKDAFVYPEIQYQPVSAAETADRETFGIAGGGSPLQLWSLDAERLTGHDAKGSRERTRGLIATAIAGEVSRLIHLGQTREAVIGDRGISAADMAVLVRDRYEAQTMQEALQALHVPNVLHSAGNVFDTAEAGELLSLIAAIAEPSREGLVRAALSTSLLGLSGETIAGFQTNEAGWEEWILRFRGYNRLWEMQGFIAMFRDLLRKEGIRERLLAFPDGERRLTNFLHLAEILHNEEETRRPGMAGLVKWLARRRDPDSPRSEEHELRLESDAEAVRIVTMHKSKGLEYPIVFCPGNWGDSRIKDRVFTFHDQTGPDGGWVLNLALNGRDNPHLALAERESLAENLRLLYVCLTRAKHRCYVVWGPFKDAGTSSLAYLLHPPANAAADHLDAMEEAFQSLSPADFRDNLETLATSSGGTIALAPLPDVKGGSLQTTAPPGEALVCRTLSRPIERSERIASFSYLAAGHAVSGPGRAAEETELPDRDALHTQASQTPVESPAGIFALPRGARTGTLLHEILERIDFRQTDRKTCEDLVEKMLNKHGFDPVWRDVVCDMLVKVLETPLSPEQPDLSLSRIGAAERISELEFYHPLQTVTPETLQDVFFRAATALPSAFPERIGRLRFQPSRGFMRGFIDLVFEWEGRFYLVDWKSNDLGHRREYYGPEALNRAMSDEYYVLQYHLYTLALHRYLQTRIPGYDYDSHFGGVFYIFLRGVDPLWGPGFGIFRDRPKRATVEALERHLIGETED